MGLFFGKKKKNFTDELCRYFKMDRNRLIEFLMRGEKNYIPHTINRKKKQRTVWQPDDRLRAYQIFAVKNVFSKYPVSQYSAAYEKGCSIQKNAAAHIRSANHMIKFDISNFFGSVNFAAFSRLLSADYCNDDINVLWLICSLREGLPVGAYSSPFVANRIMYEFDHAIGKAYRSVTYTRYADDMVFSSVMPLVRSRIEADLRMELGKLGMDLNNKKTRSYSPKNPKKVTGVTVGKKGLHVGARFKTELKKQIYNYVVKGKGNRHKILGKLAFVSSTEPAYYKKLCAKYNLHNKLA